MATASKAATKQTAAKASAKKPASKATSGKTGDEGSRAKPSGDKASAAGTPAAKGTGARKPNPAFMKPLEPSPELAAIVGKDSLPRTEVVKKMWEYIKQHDLQDPSNKRLINADAPLEKVFGKSQVNMFEMTGLVGKHLK